jgi:Flp pilus assembly protein TadB
MRSPIGWAALVVSVLLAALGHVLIHRIAAVDP